MRASGILKKKGVQRSSNTYTPMHVHIYIYTHMCLHIHLHIHVYMYVYLYVYVYMSIHGKTFYVSVSLHAHVIYISLYIYTHVRIYANRYILQLSPLRRATDLRPKASLPFTPPLFGQAHASVALGFVFRSFPKSGASIVSNTMVPSSEYDHSIRYLR